MFKTHQINLKMGATFEILRHSLDDGLFPKKCEWSVLFWKNRRAHVLLHFVIKCNAVLWTESNGLFN